MSRSSVGTHGTDSRTSPPPVTVVSRVSSQPNAAAGTSARTRNACRPHHRTNAGATTAASRWSTTKKITPPPRWRSSAACPRVLFLCVPSKDSSRVSGSLVGSGTTTDVGGHRRRCPRLPPRRDDPALVGERDRRSPSPQPSSGRLRGRGSSRRSPRSRCPDGRGRAADDPAQPCGGHGLTRGYLGRDGSAFGDLRGGQPVLLDPLLLRLQRLELGVELGGLRVVGGGRGELGD